MSTVVEKLISAPAAERNKEPILQALKDLLGDRLDRPLKVLEIASGSGQHITHFAKNLPSSIQWIPSDMDKRYFPSISGYVAQESLSNVSEPLWIDITSALDSWPEEVNKQGELDVIFNANMVHISPYETSIGLFDAAGKLLKPKGLLITYGPYAENGLLEPESNVKFDEGLRAQNPQWGVRDIEDLESLGKSNGIGLVKKVNMPANNKILVWEKQ